MKLSAYLIRSTIVASLGGLLFGFDTAVISGVTRALTQNFQLTPTLLGITVASALVGTVFGSMLAGIPADRIGRRGSLRIMAVLYLVSALGCAFSWDWYSVMFFRFIGGLGIGGSSVLGSMYIAEISPAKWRGRLVGFFQFNVIFGMLLAYFSNYMVGLTAPAELVWRWKLGIPAIPAAIFLAMLYTIPRSPRWLVQKGRVAEAKEVLRLTGAADYDEQVRDIVQSIDAEHGHAHEPLLSRKYAFPIFLAVSLAIFNQLTGINAILYYLNDIFGWAGFTGVSGDLQAVAVAATLLLTTTIAMVVIDKIGRKILLLVGAVGMAFALSGVAAVFATGQRQDLLVWLLACYVAFFGFSQGAVIWVYLAEVFPNRVRAKGQSLGGCTHWIMTVGISTIFPIVSAKSGAVPFVFFAVCMVVQFFVVLAFYPETRGLSLEKTQVKLGIS